MLTLNALRQDRQKEVILTNYFVFSRLSEAGGEGDTGLILQTGTGHRLFKRGDILPPGVSVISHYEPFENLPFPVP